MGNYTNDAVELLMELIAIPSVSRSEDQSADKLSEYLDRWNLPHGREGNNLWVGCQDWDNNRKTVMLNAHIDTVKPTGSWQRDPFRPMLDGDGLVATLQAYRILLNRNRNFNILWLASAEEEVSGENGLRRVLPLMPPIDVAIVGEPTGMQPATAERGLMVIDGYVHGVSGHAAREEGVNAIYEALDDLVWLRDYHFRKESELLGATKMTVTVVESGTQHNVIPDLLHFVIDVRTNEFYQNEFVFEFLKKKMTKCELQARSFRLHSSSIAADHPLVKRCLERGMKPFGSPTLSDQALMPWPSLKLGPGDSARSHTADEFITIGEIDEAINTYVGLLEGLII